MLMTESQLRTIIRHSILLENQNKKQGLENNEVLVAVEPELEELPAGFLSKLESIIDKDVQELQDQPVGDEALIMMGAAALVSGPVILKGLKWIAKQIAKGLQKIGLNDAGEDVWWTGLAMDDPNCWYHKWHHFYQDNCEAFGVLILKLFGNDNPTPGQRRQAGNVVFLTCCIIMAVLSFGGLLHALHDHNLWAACGETILSCIETGEVLYLLSTICAVAMGKDVQEHAEEHGIDAGAAA
mgnify:CR=1 FL=1